MFRALLNPTLRKAVGNAVAKNKQFVRNSGHAVAYRTAPAPHSTATRIGAEVVGAAMWWWIFWHLWHEPDHITGEFPYPDTAAWTNKELGIPAESA